MRIQEKALKMLGKYALCNNCLGRQFALLSRGVENETRGRALKLGLMMEASALRLAGDYEGTSILEILTANGLFSDVEEMLLESGNRVPQAETKPCFLCESKFQSIDALAKKAIDEAAHYEHTTFLVGIELPVYVEEREDEFKAHFSIAYGESIRHEFGRVLGKLIEQQTGKSAEFRKPDLTIVVNPFTVNIKVQPNPLFVTGRYRKLVRDIPQSKWFCSDCWGKGCEKCGGTGKLYPVSVEELVSAPLLKAAEGEETTFHASGREDVDARMLGGGRPFVIEISRPRRRFIDLSKIKQEINVAGKGKVQVSSLELTNRDVVRHLKKAESAQKEYRMLVEFDREVKQSDLGDLEERLTDVSISQRTPLRVIHRRADLTREKYIYKVKVKKVSPKQAEIIVRCQGGLYVKELVSGDQGRTVPSVSALLGVEAKTLKLDVLKVIVGDLDR